MTVSPTTPLDQHESGSVLTYALPAAAALVSAEVFGDHRTVADTRAAWAGRLHGPGIASGIIASIAAWPAGEAAMAGRLVRITAGTAVTAGGDVLVLERPVDLQIHAPPEPRTPEEQVRARQKKELEDCPPHFRPCGSEDDAQGPEPIEVNGGLFVICVERTRTKVEQAIAETARGGYMCAPTRVTESLQFRLERLDEELQAIREPIRRNLVAHHFLRGDRSVCRRETDGAPHAVGVEDCVPIAVIDTKGPWVDNWMVRRRLAPTDLDMRRGDHEEEGSFLPVERLLPYQNGWRARAEARIHQFHEQAWIDDGADFEAQDYRWLPPVGLLPHTEDRVFGCDAGERRRISRSQAQYLLDALVPHAPVPVYSPRLPAEEESLTQAQASPELTEAHRQRLEDAKAREEELQRRNAEADARWEPRAEEIVVYEVRGCDCPEWGEPEDECCDHCGLECLLFTTAHAIGRPEHKYGAARYGCGTFEDCCCGKDHR